MSSAKARAVEALVGAAGGAAFGAIGGRLAYEPKKPAEWRDEYGMVYSRPLTDKEKLQRKKVMGTAALLGALGGGGASLAGSAIRRSALTKAEELAAPNVKDEFLQGLYHLADKEGKRFSGQGPRQGMLPFVEEIRRAGPELEKQKTIIDDILGQVSSARDEAPWGGVLLDKMPPRKNTGEGVLATYGPSTTKTHRGAVGKYYRDLQREHDLPPIAGKNSEHFGEEFFSSLLEKTSTLISAPKNIVGV